MSEPFDNDTLVAYLFGDLPPDAAEAVARAAAADPALVAKLDALRQLVGADLSDPVGTPHPPTRRLFFRRAAAVVGGAVAAGGAGYAGYALVVPPPLLADDFSSGRLSGDKWDVNRGRRRARVLDEFLRLMNRGAVVTARDFPEPVEVRFDWRWVDVAEDPLYPDELRVALRTAGRFHPQHNFSVTDGVEVGIYPGPGRISIVADADGRPITILAHTLDEVVSLPPDQWVHVRITDDGRRVGVYLAGEGIDRKYATTPVLAVDTDVVGADRRIAIYNREQLASADHESHIDNIVVRRLRD